MGETKYNRLKLQNIINILTNDSTKTCSSFLSVRRVNSENSVLRTYSPGVTSVTSD